MTKPTTRKRHPKCDHGVYKDMCDLCKPAPRPPANFGLAHPRLTLLAEATAIPAKCERLVKKWRREAACLSGNYPLTMYELSRCADELEKLLK